MRLVAAVVLTVLSGPSLQAASPRADIRPGELWLDVDGKPINAHAGGVLYQGGTYYWYGQHMEGATWTPTANRAWGGARVNVVGISCYSSRDLLHWKSEGIVLAAVKDDETHDLHTSRVVERPKVVHNERTGKYVMWMHVDTEDYSYARAGVAVADSPTGPFECLGSVRPNGNMSSSWGGLGRLPPSSIRPAATTSSRPAARAGSRIPPSTRWPDRSWASGS